jgi:hypothetical protein
MRADKDRWRCWIASAAGIPHCARDDIRSVIPNRCWSHLNIDDQIGEESLNREVSLRSGLDKKFSIAVGILPRCARQNDTRLVIPNC